MLNMFLPLKIWKKHTQKLLIIGSDPFFQYCQLAQIQPKSQFLFYKNLSLTAGLLYDDFDYICLSKLTKHSQIKVVNLIQYSEMNILSRNHKSNLLTLKTKIKQIIPLGPLAIFSTLHCHSLVLLLSIQRKTWSSFLSSL